MTSTRPVGVPEILDTLTGRELEALTPGEVIAYLTGLVVPDVTP